MPHVIPTKIYKCEICSKDYSNHATLSEHKKRVHIEGNLKKHYCRMCGRSFRSQNELVSHTRMHIREAPYACYFCSKTSKRLDDMHRHLIIHITEKPFNCNTCNMSFNVPSSLRNHCRRRHPRGFPLVTRHSV